MGDFKKESGYSFTKKLFQEKILPTALFVVNNQMTIGALNALTELGVRIPEDLSFIGFDDMEWYPLINPSLTTIEQSPYLMGKKAGEMLIQKISHKRRNSKKVVIPSRLFIRNSTAKVTPERR